VRSKFFWEIDRLEECLKMKAEHRSALKAFLLVMACMTRQTFGLRCSGA
jgi:hypothetical protein